MASFRRGFALLSLLLAQASYAAKRVTNAKTPPVEIKGNAFFTGSNRFYLRGVGYQPGGPSSPVDSLANIETCKRDAEKFAKLGINTIRTYAVDNTANHDECMKVLADLGIYVAVDVGSESFSLNNEAPWAVNMSYNDVYLQNVFATVELFSKYDNTLLFFSGNEVMFDRSKSFTAPYIKAVTRDIKQYLKGRGLRQIPVGYAAVDTIENREQIAQYLNCGSNEVRADFFGINDYSWCAPSSFENSGWKDKVAMYQNLGVPVFFSEYGCKTNGRTFEEVAALYSDQMTGVYSGGLVYEYSLEANAFGLVKIENGAVTEEDSFALFQEALEKTPSPQGAGGYKENGAASQCPKAGQWWNVTDTRLPLVPTGAQKYFTEGAGAGKGLKYQLDGKKCSHFCGKASPGLSGADGASGAAGSGKNKTNAAVGKEVGYLTFGAGLMAALLV